MGNYRIYHCPFYEKRIKCGILCEGGMVVFPDERAAIDLIRSTCANEVMWSSCPIAKTLNKYYDRIEEQNNGKS
jgi:hypothetical protein